MRMNQTPGASNSEISVDATNSLGYQRPSDLQARFDRAAAALRDRDSQSRSADGQRQLAADLVLEGGGVKGIGLVGAVLTLHEAGYSFPRIAGTSAGAIAAVLIAAIQRAGHDMTELKTHVEQLDYAKFMPEGPLQEWLQEHARPAADIVDAARVLIHEGMFSGDYLDAWLRPKLDDLGVRTFAQLAITPEADPGMSLPPERRYAAVVHASDITRNVLVHLPWDYDHYGLQRDSEDVVSAVRASMSIPFFFRPVRLATKPADVSIPRPDGGMDHEHYAGGSVTLVDGGMLANFPISAFDRQDGRPPRWPTIGIKLSARPREFPKDQPCRNALEEAMSCLRTMTNEWDRYHVEQAAAANTIFVDSAGISATDFHLTVEDRDRLLLSGIRAATDYVIQKAGVSVSPSG
jgi:NTE family protein